jgi:hypothetical protein
MSALAGMEAGVDPCPTGDRCRLASRRIQVVLEVALAASRSCGEKVCKQRIARTHLPHGSREPAFEIWRGTGIPGSVWLQIGIDFLTSGRGLTVGFSPFSLPY